VDKLLNDQFGYGMGDQNIIRDIINNYLGLIGLYREAKPKLVINTLIFPIKFILGFPARFFKFVINSVFDIHISEQNFMVRSISFIVNSASWITAWFGFFDRIGYSNNLNEVINTIKNVHWY
jgi:hypothetical protein